MDNQNERFYAWQQLYVASSPSAGGSSLSDTGSSYGSSPHSFAMPLVEDYPSNHPNGLYSPSPHLLSPQHAHLPPRDAVYISPQIIHNLLYQVQYNADACDALSAMLCGPVYLEDESFKNLLNRCLEKHSGRYCCTIPSCKGHQDGWSRADRAREHFQLDHLSVGHLVCQVCGVAIKRHHDFKEHMRGHNEAQQNYRCQVPNCRAKPFTKIGNLHRHEEEVHKVTTNRRSRRDL